MKLGFEESQTPYTSGSQSARSWTERWVRDWVYCPNNKHVKEKIRQQLQVLRDRGYLDFVSRGCYRLRATKLINCNSALLNRNLRLEYQLAWFLNHYMCDRCDSPWTDEWSCMCDDDCPRCGARHMSPYKSDDLTEIIKPEGNAFVVLWSPETAEDEPDYCELGSFPTREQAEAWLAKG